MKKRFILMSGALLVLVVLFGILDSKEACSYLPDYSITWCVFFGQALILFPAIFIFSVSLALFRTSDEIFLKWKRFTWFCVAAYLLIYVFSPNVVPDFVPFYKETVAVGAMFLYVVVSLIYLVYLRIQKK